MNRKYAFVLLAALALMVGLAAPAAAQGKTLTVSWPQEPDSLNPMYTTMTFAGYTYQLFLAATWEFDENYELAPILVGEIPSAGNGGISEDGTTFTLKLKDGLTWSDGDPLDSADFVFTYEMYMSDKNTPLTRTPWEEFESIEAPDPTTVVIKFAEPYAPWSGQLSLRPIPEHILRPVFEADGTLDNAAWNSNPTVGSGAFILQEWDRGNFARFAPNPNFAMGAPKIETLVVTFIPDDQAYVASLEAGDSELGTFIDPRDVPRLQDAGLDVRLIPSGYNEGWFFNASPERAHPAMTDLRVRKAIALGFDRFSMVEDLLGGVLPVGHSYWEQTPYANPDLPPVPYDPEQAKALLDEAGWVDTNGNGIRDKDGVELELRFVSTTRQIRQDMKALAQQQLGEIGIGISIENYESNVFFNGYAEGGPAATGQYDIATWSSSPGGFPDPDTNRFQCDQVPSDDNPVGGNWNYYCDPALDELFAKSRVTTDFDERVAIYHQIDKLIYDSYIWINTWYDADIWVVGSRVQNARLNGTTPFFDVVNWDVAG